MPTREPYRSNLTDAEWKLIESLIPGPRLFGRSSRYSKRAILDAIFYVDRDGARLVLPVLLQRFGWLRSDFWLRAITPPSFVY